MRRLSDADLKQELENQRRELLSIRCKVALSEDVKPSEVKRTRRDIARLLTISKERELASAMAPTAGSEE
jgi:large subunit ribosomal protein L29